MGTLAADVDMQTLATIKAARLAGIRVLPSSALEKGQQVLLVSPHDYDLLKRDYEANSNGES